MTEHEHARKADIYVPLDDCWNRIGTRGDKSCPSLAQYLRCVHCPVFEQAAARMLDRPADIAANGLPAVNNTGAQHGEARREGSLVFRVGAEWFVLPAKVLQHVDEARPIHSLPNRRSPVVLGVVNVRGVLTLAASLAALLHIEAEPAARANRMDNRVDRKGRPRLLVTEWNGETTAFPVDDVDGVAHFSADALLPVPATLAQGKRRHVHGIFSWRERSIGVLDVDALFEALLRSLR
jgi:chemotaxis-related protein WspD